MDVLFEKVSVSDIIFSRAWNTTDSFSWNTQSFVFTLCCKKGRRQSEGVGRGKMTIGLEKSISTSRMATGGIAVVGSVLAMLCLLLTSIWLGLLTTEMVMNGPPQTFQQAAARAALLDWSYYATFINAVLITFAVSAFYAVLCSYLKSSAPPWIVIGFVFLPVYTMLNLVVYLSQVTLVPWLLELRGDPVVGAFADLLLQQVLQSLPTSGISFVNGLAYAILGIPSILFGWILWPLRGPLRWVGFLLALNGVACILGIIGLFTGNALISLGTVIGGVLFLPALFLLIRGLWSE